MNHPALKSKVPQDREPDEAMHDGPRDDHGAELAAVDGVVVSECQEATTRLELV